MPLANRINGNHFAAIEAAKEYNKQVDLLNERSKAALALKDEVEKQAAMEDVLKAKAELDKKLYKHSLKTIAESEFEGINITGEKQIPAGPNGDQVRNVSYREVYFSLFGNVITPTEV